MEDKSSVKLISIVRLRNEYNNLLDNGRILRLVGQFEEAGEAYLEAAELVESQRSLRKYKIWALEKSAECFIQSKSIKALLIFRKVIDHYLKKEDINKAIQRCAEYGHHCRKDLSDAEKGEEFFNEADELRHKYILSHTCVRTLFDPSEFDEDLNKAYAEKIKFYEKDKNACWTRIAFLSLCRNCVEAYKNLSEYINEREARVTKKQIETN